MIGFYKIEILFFNIQKALPSKQTNKQANKQTSKQTNKLTSKQIWITSRILKKEKDVMLDTMVLILNQQTAKVV
jgi:hypothetical protein